MDEQAITLAAEAALGDLELDCKVNLVQRSPDGDRWCVQFSGQYGQFCDDFQDQFDNDNSSRLVREKIKRYLLKQVTRIRNTTGKTKRPRTEPLDNRKHKTAGSKPFGFLGDVLDRASQFVDNVAESASGVAVAARDAVVDVADKLTPVSIEVQGVSRGVSRTTAKKPSQPSKRKVTPAGKMVSKGTRKESPPQKKGKKTSKSTAKRGGKKKSAGSKKPNKTSVRRSR